MEVKREFIQSELGLIPEDWEFKLFGDVITGFSSGATPYRGKPEFYKGKIRWITSGELNYNFITDTIEKITTEAVSKTNLKIHPVGTFLIAITGLEAAGTRGRCGFVGKPSTTNQSCMALYPIKGKLDNKYLYHYYVWQGNNLAFKFCQGTKQQSYTANIAKLLPIICPPFKEQQAIAEVLSDTDNLIQALEKQIEKKLLIKQGMMQKLLTPKDRWVVKKLREVCKIYGRIGFRGYTTRDLVKKHEGAISLSPSNILDGKLDFSKCTYISWFKYHESPEIKIFQGDIVFVKTASIGKVALVKQLPQEITLNPQLIVFKQITIDNIFLSYYLSHSVFQKQIKTILAGGVVPTLSQALISNFDISIPESIDEQNQIATILSNIDDEIDFFENKLSKYKLMKEGLMQHLLTGRLRLI